MKIYGHEQKMRKLEVPIRRSMPVRASGDAPWRAMDEYLTSRQLCMEIAVANDWYPSYDANDRFLRLVIPTKTMYVGHKYWQARLIHTPEQVIPEGVPRYHSAYGSRLDALVVAVPGKDVEWKGICIVEGPFDALAAAGEGWQGIALMGTKPSFAQFMHILQFHKIWPTGKRQQHRVICVPDRDSPELFNTVIKYLGPNGVHVTRVDLTDANDLASLTQEQRKEVLA